ncbi:hypothetical protein C1637_25025 [Chryseobacterium lactis]|uniref:Uncharacterized protein n=2 Tax=Chryseobacterium lactis TaxID=1241981 RepID=A0AA92BAG2_CHRLC|nr:hypothetical protein C1637_25025 [Chryseobacterium lactis]
MNAVVIEGDKLIITLIPTDNKRKSVRVKIFIKGEYFDNKRVSYEQYQKIINIILSIKQEELELQKKQNHLSGVLDGGSNSLYFKKDNMEKKIYNYGISKDNHKKFYEATELILKAANLEINDIE